MPGLHPDVERVALLGWRLAPVSRYSKASCFKGAPDHASHDLDMLEQWSGAYPGCNWRVYMAGSGIFALDCDVPPGHAHDGLASLDVLQERYSKLPPAPTTRSGGGGRAYIFRHDDEPIIGRSGHPAPGIDPLRGRQGLMIPPSVHLRTKQPYIWLVPPWEVSPPPAPKWLLRLLRPPPVPKIRRAVVTDDDVREVITKVVGKLSVAKEGERNATLNTQAFRLGVLVGRGLLSDSEATDVLYRIARAIGLDNHESLATIKSGLKGGYNKWT